MLRFAAKQQACEFLACLHLELRSSPRRSKANRRAPLRFHFPQDNCRPDVRDAGLLEQGGVQEFLVVLNVRHMHRKDVVGRSGGRNAAHDLRAGFDRLLSWCRSKFTSVTATRLRPTFSRSDHDGVAADHARGLHLLDSAPAGRGRQADLVRDLLHRLPVVAPAVPEDLQRVVVKRNGLFIHGRTGEWDSRI